MKKKNYDLDIHWLCRDKEHFRSLYICYDSATVYETRKTTA